jgi:hypothetical protein
VGRRCARTLIAGCAAILAATPGAASALAATTWTIKPGGAIKATSGTATFRDTKTRSTITCTAVTADGTLKSGSGLSGADAGSVSSVAFSQCTNPIGPRFAPRVRLVFVLQPTRLPWHVNLSSYGNGVATGGISHMRIKAINPGCQVVLEGTSATASDGSVKFSYAGSTGKLTVLRAGGTLHIYNVMGCAGLFAGGDPVTLSTTFTVSPKQRITSP